MSLTINFVWLPTKLLWKFMSKDIYCMYQYMYIHVYMYIKIRVCMWRSGKREAHCWLASGNINSRIFFFSMPMRTVGQRRRKKKKKKNNLFYFLFLKDYINGVRLHFWLYIPMDLLLMMMVHSFCPGVLTFSRHILMVLLATILYVYIIIYVSP